MRKTGLGIVIEWSDPHHPYCDEMSMAAVYDFAKAYPADYHVLMGDNLNNGGISRHVQDDLVAQYEEPMIAGLLSFGKHVDRIFEVNPRTQVIWIWGNHDDWMVKAARKMPGWLGIMDKPLRLLREFGECKNAMRVRIVQKEDPEEHFSIGRMAYVHGWYTGKHCAAQHVEAMGESIVCGHTHTMQSHTIVRKGRPCAGYTIGNLMSKEARRYMKGRPQRWVTGFGVMEYDRSSGAYTQHLLPIVDGQFIFGGKRYGRAART